jgi:predicted amidohydrolase YtcJ
MSPITVFQARKILTMNPVQPQATHAAVRDGRVLAVGDLDRVGAWGNYTLDTRFADQVLMPGLVEGHAHLTAGGLAQYSFVGFHPRPAPAGLSWPGCRSFDEVVAQLQAAEAALTDPDAPLLAWGFDPIFFGTERMTVEHLDRVSTTRLVVILHASHHLLNVNSAALRKAGIDRETDVEGVARFTVGTRAGEPNGELQEFAAMFPVLRVIGNAFRATGTSEAGLRRFGELAQRAGVTTSADFGNDPSDEGYAMLTRVTAEAAFPVRIVPGAMSLNHARSMEEHAALLHGRIKGNTDKLHYGIVKLFADGSIQGFSARLRWPGYFNGHANGIWNQPPEQLKASIDFFHAQGFQLHIHTNGDEATEVALDALDAALTRTPRRDHRHTLQHCQMADEALFRRMANLGVCANLFANHLYYWGEAHRTLTLGPDRAERMDACATALRLGVPLAVHSDAPITALAPMFTAWCAVNRLTSSGHVLGANERISVADALRTITLGAAYTLGLDDRIGSIEVGKFADFCVMDDDPTEIDPVKLKDVRIAGTVLGGLPT